MLNCLIQANVVWAPVYRKPSNELDATVGMAGMGAMVESLLVMYLPVGESMWRLKYIEVILKLPTDRNFGRCSMRNRRASRAHRQRMQKGSLLRATGKQMRSSVNRLECSEASLKLIGN